MKIEDQIKPSMLKKSTSILMIALLTSCAITPKQINSNKEIKKAVRLCVESLSESELTGQTQVHHNYLSYSNSSKVSAYKNFLEVKEKYPKEWENFKEKHKNKANFYYGKASEADPMDNIWSGFIVSVFTIGIAPFVHSINLIASADKQDKTYPELLRLCDQKIDAEMQEVKHQKEIRQAMQPELDKLNLEKERKNKAIFEAEQKRQEKLQKEIKLFLQAKGFSRMIDGLKYAVSEAYFLDKKANLKTSLVIFNPNNGNENGLSVVSLQDNYAIYSNKVFTVAIKQRPNKSYLKDSLINGTYYKFIGTKRFNNKDFGKDELVLFEEVIGLEKYDQDLVRRTFN